MHDAINKLEHQYKLNVNHLLIDGNRFNQYNNVPHSCVIKGDNMYYSIAAASILAKVARDEYMKKLGADFPGYGWENNAGYGTRVHRDFIVSNGVTEHHRMSFLGNILPKNTNSLF
jgi:ribonuclease HII